MKNKMSTKALEKKVNDLCVKTYLHVLGHGCFVARETGKAFFKCPFSEAGPLIVDYATNRFRSGDGNLSGGVLDLASALFNQPKDVILSHIALYRIDLLMMICGNSRGSSWQPLSLNHYATVRYSHAG
jgi:hypothetical protein